jgi:hypothetical protein
VRVPDKQANLHKKSKELLRYSTDGNDIDQKVEMHTSSNVD